MSFVFVLFLSFEDGTDFLRIFFLDILLPVISILQLSVPVLVHINNIQSTHLHSQRYNSKKTHPPSRQPFCLDLNTYNHFKLFPRFMLSFL